MDVRATSRLLRRRPPIDPEVAAVLLRRLGETIFKAPGDWVFARPFTAGRKPYHGWSAQNQVLSPAGVQKDLMRHSSISTTMNVYGRAIPQDQRIAHSNVVVTLKKAVGTF